MLEVLVVDAWMPTPDRDAGSQRMVQLLALLDELCAKVSFAGDGPSPLGQSDGSAVPRRIGTIPTGPESITRHLERHGRRYGLVVLSRLPVASKYLPTVRRHAPQARVVFDTVDLHYLRGFRAAKTTSNAALLKRSLLEKRQELALVRDADCTVVVSGVEREILERECPGAQVQVVSLIEEATGSTTRFADREGVLFVGAFPHYPNVDAMEYFCRDVLPRLDARPPRLRVTIVGTEPPPWLRERQSDRFDVLGHVPRVEPYLDRCRVSIAPLRYGAGIKGKVVMSMGRGVPVVASSTAAEGISARPGEDMLVADSPTEFADAIVRLHEDETLWSQVSASGVDLVATRFSIAAARTNLSVLLQRLDLSEAGESAGRY